MGTAKIFLPLLITIMTNGLQSLNSNNRNRTDIIILLVNELNE